MCQLYKLSRFKKESGTTFTDYIFLLLSLVIIAIPVIDRFTYQLNGSIGGTATSMSGEESIRPDDGLDMGTGSYHGRNPPPMTTAF